MRCLVGTKSAAAWVGRQDERKEWTAGKMDFRPSAVPLSYFNSLSTSYGQRPRFCFILLLLQEFNYVRSRVLLGVVALLIAAV